MADVEKFASESAIRMIVGNKADAEDKRKVTYEEGKELAARYNVKFLETSAKSSKGVIESFQTLSREIKSKVLPKKTTGSTPGTASTKSSKFFNINSFIAPVSGAKKLSANKGKRLDSGACCA